MGSVKAAGDTPVLTAAFVTARLNSNEPWKYF
jgi:hypothetical protein